MGKLAKKTYDVYISFPMDVDYREVEDQLAKTLRRPNYDSGAGFGFRDLNFYCSTQDVAKRLRDKARAFFKKKQIKATIGINTVEG